MTRIRPFAAIRPIPELAAEIAAPPYDVVDEAEARAIAGRKPRTFLRVTRPEIDHQTQADPEQILATARRNLEQMVAQGWMVRDSAPCLYLYELTLGQHVQIGLLAGVSLEEYAAGQVKRHEHTRARELDDRTRHIDVVGANTGLIFMTYRARPEIDSLVTALRQRSPTYDFDADDGVHHRVWVIDDAADIGRLVALFAQVPALYIADGHHRTSASHQVQQMRRARQPDLPPDAACDYVLAALFPQDQIHILPYNRVVLELNGYTSATLLAAIADKFEVQPATTPQPDRPATFGMFIGGAWHRLVARAGSYPANDRQRSLDAAILQDNLLQPLLGIDNPRTDRRIEFIGGIRGTEELQRRATASGGAAFCLYPVAMEQVMAVADAGEVMPPKSTWFEPKLRSGLVVRSIEED